MKRLFVALLVSGCVATSSAPGSAQLLVADPILQKFATQQWVQDIKNAQQFYNIAVNGAQQLQQAIQQTQYMLKNAKTLQDYEVAGRQANSEWLSLQNLAKVDKGIIAATGHASKDIAAQYSNVKATDKASVIAQNYQTNMKGTIMSAAQTVDARLNQMNDEETLLANLRTQVKNAQSGNLGTNQLLQLGLAISSEQLDEIRSMERMMAVQFQTQYALQYAQGDAATKQILAQASVESFFAPRAAAK